MNPDRREQLERLLSEWLDEPGREELRSRVDALVGDDAELIAIRRTWLRMNAVFRAPPRVNWAKQRERIMTMLPAAPLSSEQTDQQLDAVLRASSGAAPVNWGQLQARVSQAVAAATGARRAEAADSPLSEPRIVRFPSWKRAIAGVGLAAAALLALWLAPHWLFTATMPTAPKVNDGNFVMVRVTPVKESTKASHDAAVQVTMRVAAMRDDSIRTAPPDEQAIAAASEDLFMIDPLAPAATPATSEEYGLF